MALQIKYCFVVIFLLSFKVIKSNETDDFKTKFGEEYGSALKQYNAEMTQALLDNFRGFYSTLLRDLNGTEEHNRVFRMRLLRITSLKEKIGTSITAETLRMSKSLIGTMLFEILSFSRTKFIADDPDRSKIIVDGLKLCNEKEQEGARLFREKLQTKWRSMFKTIPAEELQKHIEYTDINELMESSTEDYTAMLKNTAEIWRLLTEFFNYDEYTALFKKKTV